MKYLVLDIEGTKKPNHLPWTPGSCIVNVGVHRPDGSQTVYWFNHDHITVDAHDSLLKLQAEIDAADMLVAHNIKFDLSWLKHIGLNVQGKQFWCTMVAEYLLQGQRKVGYDLSTVAGRYGVPPKFDEVAKLWNEGYETTEIPVDMLAEYVLQDVRITNQIFLAQQPLIEKYGLSKLAYLSFEVSDILSDAELTGAAFDDEEARRYLEQYNVRVSRIDKKLFELLGFEFNIGSPTQLSAVLFGGKIKRKIREHYTVTLKSGVVKDKSRWAFVDDWVDGCGFKPPENSETSRPGVYSTDQNIIKQLHARSRIQRYVRNLLLLRAKMAKVISTFLTKDGDSGLLNKIGTDGRIHPTFNQCITSTGRLSSSNPNGQNLPRKGTSPIKRVFKPSNGVIVNVDLAQIEYRIAAALSKDTIMVSEIVHGLDAHAANAETIFGADPNDSHFDKVRTTAKVLTFRLLYGGTPAGFFRDSSMPAFTLDRWKEIVDNYWKKYVGLKDWQNRNIKEVSTKGFLRNPSGRILGFTQKRGYSGEWGFSPTQACNFPVQSSSADIMYLAMVVLRKRLRDLGLRSKMILQVHDSMVFDAFPEEVDIICETAVKTFEELPELAMKYWGWHIPVPLTGDCEVGPNYGALKKYNAWQK